MLKYTLTQQKRQELSFLLIQFQGKRRLYRDLFLQEMASKEAALFFMEEQLRYLGAAGSDTAIFNQIYVRGQHAFKALALLGLVPEKEKAPFSYDNAVKKFRLQDKTITRAECQLYFSLPAPWLFYEGKLWLIGEEEKKEEQEDSLPRLYLKDRTGAFAMLRQKEWEKDLLESGFQKKEAEYYCPMDKVVPTLRFLLELGWEVIDAQGRKVYLHGMPTIALSADGETLCLEGTVACDGAEIELKHVANALKKQSHFLDLSSSVVLIDAAQFPKELPNLVEKRPKREFGLFQAALKEEIAHKIAPFTPSLPSPCFQGALYPYQQEGLNWLQFLYHGGFHGLLSDEMGLGKTVQVLAFLSLLESKKPILIVVPTSLIFNWQRELGKFLPSFPMEVRIVSYTRLRLDLPHFQSLDYECLILDEAQMVKNSKSQTAQAVYQLKSRFRLAITGTPIENRMEDLFSLFHFLMPKLLEDPAMAHDTVRPFILRRTKAVIADQLPEKVEQVVWVEMEEEQKALYEQLLQSRRHYTKQMEMLETLLRLRQICCHPKLVDSSYSGACGKFDRFLEDVETVVSEGQKVLIYSQFTQMLKLIAKELKVPYLYLDGETKERAEVVDAFQNDPDALIFLVSLKAGGVGLNLTKADYVFIYDPWWNEAAEKQAVDRAHRLGRQGTLITRRYVTVSSIEEKMMALKERKAQLLDGLFDHGSVNIEELYNSLTS